MPPAPPRHPLAPTLLLPLVLLGAGAPHSRGTPPTNSLGAMAKALEQQMAEQALGTLLNNQLPLKLDANAIYPTVAEPPGGPFHPLPLQLTADMMNEPLPPGDYSLRALAFCSEYSVHRPGAGVAYEVGPVQGKAAPAIAMLLWRGTLEKRVPAHSLQAVSWAIQAGVTYAKMPKTYQAIVDEVIPEYRNQLGGDFIQNLEDLYENTARTAGLPPLAQLLAGMGRSGQLALTADRQRRALLWQNTTDQRREQILFAGQESRIAPIKAADGPWTERIPGVAYVRYRVVGGNMATNNEIQLRILPPPPLEPPLGALSTPRVIFASFHRSDARRIAAGPSTGRTPPQPTLFNTIFGGIGYSIARGAQALYFVPLAAAPGTGPAAGGVGSASGTKGTTTLTHGGTTTPLADTDQVHMSDTVTTGAKSGATITFADGTVLSMGENTTITIDQYIYDPANPAGGSASYSWLGDAFQYVSGLIGKDPAGQPPDINTPVGVLGIRGTEFVAGYDAWRRTVGIDLISGALELSPKRTKIATPVTAPVRATFSISNVSTVPLAPDQYDTNRRALFGQ